MMMMHVKHILPYYFIVVGCSISFAVVQCSYANSMWNAKRESEQRTTPFRRAKPKHVLAHFSYIDGNGKSMYSKLSDSIIMVKYRERMLKVLQHTNAIHSSLWYSKQAIINIYMTFQKTNIFKCRTLCTYVKGVSNKNKKSDLKKSCQKNKTI